MKFCSSVPLCIVRPCTVLPGLLVLAAGEPEVRHHDTSGIGDVACISAALVAGVVLAVDFRVRQ
jgi:hypothetical protein